MHWMEAIVQGLHPQVGKLKIPIIAARNRRTHLQHLLVPQFPERVDVAYVRVAACRLKKVLIAELEAVSMFPLETFGPVQEGFGGAADERERGAQLPLKLLGAQLVVSGIRVQPANL